MISQTKQDHDHKVEPKKKPRNMKQQADSVPAFLLKTYEILENPLYDGIVGWNEGGNSFAVKRVNDFSQQILPKHFKHSNFASFVRQLNMYDFHKARNDRNENVFKHKLFLKGCKSLLFQIKRKSGDLSSPTQLQQQQIVIKKQSDKPFSEYNELVREMALLANKQGELEELIIILIKKNEKFQKDNIIWRDIMRNKQKSETKQERLLFWFLQNLSKPKGNNNNNSNVQKPSSTSTNIHNSLLMIRSDDPIVKLENQNSEVNTYPYKEKNVFQKILQDPSLHEANESQLDGLSNKQLLQGLLKAFSFQRSNNKSINNLLPKDSNDDDSSSEQQVEQQYAPVQKKVKRETKDQKKLMLCQDDKYNQRSAQDPITQTNGVCFQRSFNNDQQNGHQLLPPVIKQEYVQHYEDYICDYITKDSVMFTSDQNNQDQFMNF